MGLSNEKLPSVDHPSRSRRYIVTTGACIFESPEPALVWLGPMLGDHLYSGNTRRLNASG